MWIRLIETTEGGRFQVENFPGESSSDCVQFRSVGGSNFLILVPVYINGTGPHAFILDSGATHSMISSALAEGLGLDPDSSGQGFGAGGVVQTQSVRVHSIQVGSACQEDSCAYVLSDLEQIGVAAKSNISGLIGYDFLRDFRVTIDYGRNKLCIARSAEQCLEAIGSTAIIPFEISPAEPLILLPVLVNGHGPFQFVLDTAAGRTVVAPEIAVQCAISQDEEVMGAGVGGKLAAKRVNLESISIGDATISNLAAIAGRFLDPIAAEAGATVHGILGNDVLSRFLVTIDCPGKRLILDTVQVVDSR